MSRNNRSNRQQAPEHFGMDATNMDLRDRGDEKQFRENLRILNDRSAKNAEWVWKRQLPVLIASTSLLGLILIGLLFLLFMVRQVSGDLRVSVYGTHTPQSLAISGVDLTATSFAVAEDLQPTPLSLTDTATPEPEIIVEWPTPGEEYYVDRLASLEVIVKQGEQGKAGENVSVSVDNPISLELTAMNISTDSSGKAIISFTPYQPGDFTLTVIVGDQSHRLLVHVEILDSDVDGISDDLESLFGSDPNDSNLFIVKAPNGVNIRKFSSPDISLAVLPDTIEVFFIPDIQSSNPSFSRLFIKLSYEADSMDDNQLAKGTELFLFSQDDRKIVLNRQIECIPMESFANSQLDSIDCLIVQPENGKNVIWLFGAASLEYLTPVNPVLTPSVPAVTPSPLGLTPEFTATTFIMTGSTPEPTAGNITPVP